MQNLSFKPSVAVKPVEEVTKNNAVTSKTDQNASAQDDLGAQNSFQSLLNKQVQAKRSLENAASKSVNKTATKSTDNAQKNPQTEESDALDTDGKTDGKFVNDTHRANIDAMVARLKALKQGASEENTLATEAMAEEATAEVSEEDETLAALADAVNNLQPQDAMAQAFMRAQLQSAGAGNVAQKSEGQLTQDDSKLTVADGALSNVGASALDRALSKEMSQSSFSDSSISGADRWKDALSEKMAPEFSQENVALDQNARLTGADSKSPSLENALKFLDSENAKEIFAQEASKGGSDVGALQTQLAQAQASLNQPTQTAAQLGSSSQIMAYPGRTGWNQEISQKVVWMVGNGEQSATLTLNPPDLGPVQVVISVNNDQADASFFSDNADVRQALEDGLDNLRESMQSSGIQLGQANINAGQQSQQSFQEMAQKQLAGAMKSQQTMMDTNLPATGITMRERQGLVDTFA